MLLVRGTQAMLGVQMTFACTRYASNVGRADDVVRGNNFASRYNLEAMVSGLYLG
jgi:hypothetical protein